MKTFLRPEHQVIAEMLSSMDRDFLLANRCWFGGGTAIVMKFGEYRRSLDVDFLCADADGYRELRVRATEKGVSGFFPKSVKALREFRIDQYGLRTMLELKGQQIKFEIIREGRLHLSGNLDQDLGVPILGAEDMVAEKLLANADRCQDRSVAYRDAFDLGILAIELGSLPETSIRKAETAYGPDIGRKVGWVVNRLGDLDELRVAAEALQMQPDKATAAIAALREKASRLWPGT